MIHARVSLIQGMFHFPLYLLVSWGGRSGYPKISGRVIRVFKISGFENRYPKLQRVLHPKFRVRVRVFPNYPNYCVTFIKTHTPY
jgi:hypothetical protein